MADVHDEHYQQGHDDAKTDKPLPQLYSRAYIMGWINGRVAAAVRLLTNNTKETNDDGTQD